VLDSQIITLESNSELIDIPITPEHIPNVYVSVVLIKGVDETNPTPADSHRLCRATGRRQPERADYRH
jgi:hypothetical protein